MKYLTIFFISGSLSCFAASAQRKTAKDENWALAKIKALPEVKFFMVYARESKPMVIIARDPDSTFKYYWVKVGISNFDMFRTSDDFYIDTKTNQVYIADPMNEGPHEPNLVSLKLMRRWGKTKSWGKLHIFRGDKLIVVKNNYDTK